MAPQKRPRGARTESGSTRLEGGFSSIRTRADFEEVYGKLPSEFPVTLSLFEQQGKPWAAPKVPRLPFAVAEALLLILSRPVTQFSQVMSPDEREKPRYLLLAHILAALRHGNLILGLEDLDELWEDTEEEVDTEEDDDDLPTTEGPVEVVVLRAPSESAKGAALQEGLRGGLESGCKAVLLVEVKATAGFSNLWQALAAGIALARGNAVGGRGSYPASPVHVVFTDTTEWFFLGIQAMAAAVDEGAGGATAACSGSGAAADGSAASTRGLEFKIKTGEVFRLFDCSMIVAPLLRPSTPVDSVLQLMYRLYTALYPDESIADLPAAIREGEKLAKEAAQDWMAPRMESLQRQRGAVEAAEAAATAKSAAAAEKTAAAAQKAATAAEAAVAARWDEAVKLVQQEAAAAIKCMQQEAARVQQEAAAAIKRMQQEAARVQQEAAEAIKRMQQEAARVQQETAAAIKRMQQAAAEAEARLEARVAELERS